MPIEPPGLTIAQLLRVLQVDDSLFPIGAFAYSDGLEAAVAAGWIQDAAGLQGWMHHYVDAVLRPCDGPALWRAMDACAGDDWPAIEAIDAELTAMKPSLAVRTGSRTLGQRLLTACLALTPDPLLVGLRERLTSGGIDGNHPVVFAAVAVTIGLDPPAAVACYGYGRLAGTMSAGLRLLPIGQQAGQRVLQEALSGLPAVVEWIAAHRAAPLQSFSPLLEVQQMAHRRLYSRLFRS